MAEGRTNIVHDSGLEAARDGYAAKPDFKSVALLEEGSGKYWRNDDRQCTSTNDGKYLEFTNIFAGQQGSGQHLERLRPSAEKGEVSADRTAEGKASTLFSKDSTDEQKLAAVKELAKEGITGLTYRDASGNEHKLRMELAQAGNKQMVHLFVTGADGREQVALRGISRADGSVEHERDRSGHFVDFQGRGYSQLLSDQSSTAHDIKPDRREAKPGRTDLGKDGVHVDKLPDRTMAPGSIDRSQFDAQLKDPRVMAAFAGRMHSEVGSQGAAAQLAFAEEVMNRAAARNQTLMQALTGRYYPTHNPGSSHDPRYIAAITRAWQEGTDTIHGATGNASGRVGFGVRGGHYGADGHWVSPNQTAHINGERFGYEQVDLDKGWLAKYARLKGSTEIASRD